jgi:hypothetical protein
MMAAILLFFGLGGGAFTFLFLILPFVITIWALIDVIKSDFAKDINKLIWIIVIIGFPFFGGIIYYFVGRSQKASL